MRMWPDLAEYFLGRYEAFEIVHPWYTKRLIPIDPHIFGSFCDQEQHLHAIYIPDKQDEHNGITIEQISKEDALIEVIRNSFSPRVVKALGLQAQRMDVFTQLIRQVPVRRIIYPEGFHHLPYVRKILIDDIKSLYS